MKDDKRNAEESALHEGGGDPSVPKLTKCEKRALPAGTEWETEAVWKDPGGAPRTARVLEWQFSTGDCFISFKHLTEMGPGAVRRSLTLQSRCKGPPVGGLRQDRVEIAVISEQGEILRLPEQTVEVRVGASEEVSPEQAFKQYRALFNGAFADIRASKGREFPSGEHFQEDLETIRKHIEENPPKS